MSSPTKTILPFTVPRNLPDLVKAAFSRARASGDVNFYPTEAVILHVNALPNPNAHTPSVPTPLLPLPRQQTCAPAPLQHHHPKKPFNPFASPSPSLLITPGPSPPPLDGPTHPTSTHYLLLNKFAIVPHHFILATSAFQPQTHLLEAADLTAAYACIMAYHDYHHAGELFAFFNSGEHSGASQAHRHLQFLEVEGMKAGIPGTGGWEVWADGMVRGDGVVGKLPFRVFAGRVREGMSGEEMRGVYLGLYRQACEALGVEAGEEGEGEARLSYNMAMTRGGMVVMPRVAEGAEVRDREGAVVGRLALNGTVLAGTGLVKSREEWEALRGDPGQVGEVLRRIGVLNTSVDSVQSRAEL